MRILLACAAVALVVAAPAGAAELRSQTRSWPAGGLRSVSLTVPVGEVLVEGVDGDRVRLTLSCECGRTSAERCQERADRLRLDADVVGDRLRLDVEGMRKHLMRDRGFHVRAELQVPRGLALRVRLGVGEVDVADVAGDVDIENGVGEVSLSMDEARVADVRTQVGIGEASVRAQGRLVESAGLLGRSVHWDDGRGSAHVSIEIGVGEANVRLR
jgi:hypothetical protein